MNKQNPLVSVIIINYNGRKFLPRLLDSINHQTMKNFELIIIDSGSEDQSLEYLKKEHKDVMIYPYPNNGYAFACNRGAEAAKGKYLVFLNIDMYLPEDFLEKMCMSFNGLKKRNKNIAGLSCKMVDFDCDPSNGHSTGAIKIDIFGYTYPLYDLDKNEVFSLPGSPLFIERDTFFSLGCFCEYIFFYGEDMDLSWRANIMGYKMYVDNGVYLHHYGSASLVAYSFKWSVLIIVSELVPIINNYSLPLLVIILPLYIFYSLTLLFIYYLKVGLKPIVFKEYHQRMIYILRNLKGIWKFRQNVQNKRVISDWEILKYMSPIPAFIHKKSWKRVKS